MYTSPFQWILLDHYGQFHWPEPVPWGPWSKPVAQSQGPEGNLSKFPGRVTPMRGQDHWKLKDAQNFDCDTRAFRPKRKQRSELKKKYSLRLFPVPERNLQKNRS